MSKPAPISKAPPGSRLSGQAQARVMETDKRDALQDCAHAPVWSAPSDPAALWGADRDERLAVSRCRNLGALELGDACQQLPR